VGGTEAAVLDCIKYGIFIVLNYVIGKIFVFRSSEKVKKSLLQEKLSLSWSVFILGLIIGAVFFLGIYGHSRIIPWNDGWLMAGGDISQHYLGWRAYRASAWTFPFCLTDRLSYPITTSIMFTDSIPLWAVFF
jgi:hypothetical protein